MKRSTVVAFTALMALLLVVAACASLRSSSATTPKPSTAAKAPIAVGGKPQVNMASCKVGARDESIFPYEGSVKMTSPTTGWAIGQCALGARPSFPQGSTIQCYWPGSEFAGTLRTTDGGKSWIDVSPPSVPNRSFQHAQFFLDANHAWIGEVSRTADACASAVTTFMTSDGGLTWQQGGTIALKPEKPTSGVFDVPGPFGAMHFIDQQHGWILVSATAANPHPGGMVDPTLLYSTVDGGLHWKLVATNPGQSALGGASGCPTAYYQPASNAVFTSATSGWLAITCPPNIAALKTEDGGATWSIKPLSCTCQVWQPQYLDSTHAVITGTQGSTVLVATEDGGATWAQRPAPKAAMTLFSFLDPVNGWMVGIEQLAKSYSAVVYRTTDGGRSWALLARPSFATSSSNPSVYFPIVGVQFVTASTGFVVLGQEVGTQGITDPTAPQLQLLQTADGGRTWTTVLKQVPSAPCSASYTQLTGPNGQGDVMPVKMASDSVAWGRGGTRTTDGGAHWRDVSSPALREGAATPLYPQGYAEFYLDGNDAWQAAVYGSQSSCMDHVSTFATTDGGKTWQQSSPIQLKLPDGYTTTQLQIGFTSPQSGWLWVPMGTGQDRMFYTPTKADLYTTGDGGLSWRRVSVFSDSQLKGVSKPQGYGNCTPSVGQITFSTSTAGWLSLNCADPAMLVTQDGGATWKTASTQLQCQGGCNLPTFVDPDHGFIQAYGTKLGGNLLVTSDGGATWQPVTEQFGDRIIFGLTYGDAGHLWALVSQPGWTKGIAAKDSVFLSTDEGLTWSDVQDGVPMGRAYGLLFADGKHGMVAQARNATWSFDTPGFADAWDTVLAVTADGGHSWKIFKPAIVT